MFFIFLTLIVICVAFQGVCGIYLFISCFTDSDYVAARLRVIYGSSHVEAYAVFLAVVVGICAAGMVALMELYTFHVYLVCKKMTTYMWLQKQKEKEKEEARKKDQEERELKRRDGGESGAASAKPEESEGCCSCLAETKRRDFRAEKKDREGYRGPEMPKAGDHVPF